MDAPPSPQPLEPTRKRPRSESEPTASLQHAFSRDERFWYEDGNVIIIAQGVGFRVFKGLLAADSEVFRDMLSLAKPAPDLSRESGLDDCPVVHVTDTAAEVRSLLAILLGGRRYMRRLKFEFDDVANCIRLAHKYGIQDVLEDSLEELKKYFPATFDAFATRLTSETSTDAIVAANLARLTNTLSILPAALYGCCQLDGKELLEGKVRKDGVVDTLNFEDLGHCTDGMRRLCTLNVQLASDVFSPLDNAECVIIDRCNTSLATLQLKWIHRIPRGNGDVLAPWDLRGYDRKKKPKPSSPLCASCIALLEARATTLRQRIWSELPDVFNLKEGSEEVVSQEDAVMSQGDS
ncbi:uncharacterized protein C8Q71DRAFT_400750 [Rhodofomes roseus]|uniref:BTB domain-containing protein n=1 Tax=Rhodofomes roseus TaxID=34475 RepID=A0ABQ8JZQ7_9APHY|nr:uncharacterized protein C8Q71DRAFT_400750 [Rhodofomes roseus]KAH9829559.1 hypothetical protein C8Q71DRAFT_400750 [Rhodofomes roseus]